MAKKVVSSRLEELESLSSPEDHAEVEDLLFVLDELG